MFRWRVARRMGWVLLLLVSLFGLGACVSNRNERNGVAQPSGTPLGAVELPTLPPPTAVPTASPTPMPTTVPTPTPVPDPVCMIETLPPGYENAAAVEGLRLFTAENNLKLRTIYFPYTCPPEDVEQDAELLFFGNIIADDEVALIVLEETWTGVLGTLYGHLLWYEFWAMGPEDYPMVIERSENIETNIIIFRADKINGDGHEGNSLLGLMIGLAEHEYIHTVQGRNNPDLAEMIWNTGVYRAFIERFANVGNNTGQRYYRATYTMMTLLQVLDGLNSRGELEPLVGEVLAEKDFDIDSFLGRELAIYNKHVHLAVQTMGGDAYVAQLSSGRISPLTLVEMAGCGDLVAYDVLHEIYNRKIGDYNSWFYGTDSTQYLPASFEILFDPN
jgi:hypothetical protein